MTRLVCYCGNDEVETVPYLDDDGTPMLSVRCEGPAHGGERARSEYKDPDAPPPPKAMAPGAPLVHQLGVYDKLEDTVRGVSAEFSRPVEYGVVEHHFAYAYPETYRELGERFGHVATHGSKHYTLSAYLGLMLGNLTRQDRVRWWPTHGTGRWDYDADISGWSTLDIDRPGEMLSWAEFAGMKGFSPQDWPAREFLPEVSEGTVE